MACAVASVVAQPRDEIMLDNYGGGEGHPVPRRPVVTDQDYRDSGCRNVTTKNLTVRWIPGHLDLHTAARYEDYTDIQGNNESDTLANMGNNLPMDTLQPRPHSIVLQGHIMPTSAKLWIMQLRRQKQTTEVHWISCIPLLAVHMAPLAVGSGPLVGTGSTLGAHPHPCGCCGLRHGSSVRREPMRQFLGGLNPQKNLRNPMRQFLWGSRHPK